MKKLGRMEISSKKILNYEELISLNGGETMNCCVCGDGYTMLLAFNKEQCIEYCEDSGSGGGVWQC